MAPRPISQPLIVIVGETASGKSGLAMELATRFNGEIICADSRTVYKGMDIGTAKPTKQDQAAIPHHLLDEVKPSETFTVADFKRLAERAVTEIHSRGKLPILVGGSGLYIDSVVFNYQFSPEGSARDNKNPRHLKKAQQPSPPAQLRANTLMIGLRLPRDVLEQRITERVEEMVAQGFVQEVEHLAKTYTWDSEALRTPGYKAFRNYIAGAINLEEAKVLFIRNDMHLAKRQRSWFKRNNSIHWLDNPKEAVDIVTTFLNKK